MKCSVIIPVYNEASVILDCLQSLIKQTVKAEIVVVDDGSTDQTSLLINQIERYLPLKYLTQKHRGPGAARNLGVINAMGNILVFVDADMTFAPDFIEDLIAPIIQSNTKGTFTTEEFVSNWGNIWARCWNFNNNLSGKKRLPDNYPNTAPVFRAILKSEFIKVQGFDEESGWIDDWTLSTKLGYNSVATKAICYHKNPDNLHEVFNQAIWIGKNENISGDLVKIITNVLRYNPAASVMAGVIKMIRFKAPAFVIFKIIYDLGILVGILKSFTGIRYR